MVAFERVGAANFAVWKFRLKPQSLCTLQIPKGAQILAVQAQRDEPCIWVIVDPLAPTETRRFRIFGTGHLIETDEPLAYRGTCQLNGGALVFHVFEIEGNPAAMAAHS